MRARFGILRAIFIVMLNCFIAEAGEESFSSWKNKLGNNGLNFQASYKLDYFANTHGGIKRDQTTVSMADMNFEIDTQKISLWPNGKFFIHLIENSGVEKLSSDIVGDLQGVSNIAAPRTARLFELWYEQMLLDEKFSVLLGVEDINSEFYVSEYAGLYVNSSFGIGPEVAGGRPSVFPLAALGVRFKFLPNEHWEFLTGAYDGDPGDPDVDEHFFRSDFDKAGGVFLISQAAYRFGGSKDSDVLPGSVTAGVWHNTGDFRDLVDGEDIDGSADIGEDELFVRSGNTGGYLIVDKLLFREQEAQGLGVFLQLGGSAKNVNTVDFYVGSGLNYTGLIPSRDEDILGVAIAQARISDKLVDAGVNDKAETTIEMTYRAKINEYIAIQPDIQFILNPGANPDLKNACVVGARFEIEI